MPSIRLPYKKQGLIFFICRNYYILPSNLKEKIKLQCEVIGGDDSTALFEVVTSDHSINSIALKYYTHEKKLYYLRKRFYEEWFRK